MASVKVEKLEKVYPNGFKALHGIDLQIADGEFMVVVGPSGCAKSTLLRLIAGLEEVTSGTITIGDRVVNDLDPKDRRIAMVFQNYALYPHMTAYENMAFALKLAKLPRAEIDARVREAAAKLEIEGLLDRKPKDMSGGQRQRVAVGRAIVRKPDVFLFDEPLSNLDAKLRVSMRARLVQLHRELKAGGQRAAMVYVTHDQVEAMTMGDRITVMKDGRIMQTDTPMALYERPANKFVAGFIGSPAMNIHRAGLKRIGDQVVVAVSGQEWALAPAQAARVLASWPADGEEVWFGIRPDSIDLAGPGGEQAGLCGEISLVERTGGEAYCYFRVNGDEYVARLEGSRAGQLQPGDVGQFRVKVDEGHVFSGAGGTNISLPAV
ncbi:MAG: sn-glycerol-3-phosphate ABC transporter ATP-binding protein UgpC [Negativicutes bacterium]|nr:sn-glycerol-3-phosphate ABC transporter ATP-binding protein UgpC [Negativicutes bacterium]